MSKTYDALIKARREQGLGKEGPKPSPTVPDPQVSGSNEAAKREPPPLDESAETLSQNRRIKSINRRTRVSRRVSVGSFIAEPNSVMAEQFRKLRGLITTQKLANSLRSILITSSLPGEGKTTVALNLSSSIAQGLDDSVILVDADLRRSNLSSLLRLRNEAGLLDILEGRATIEETLIHAEIEGLTILPGGGSPGNPAELVGSNRMKKALEQLTSKHPDSYIIIDSPPIVSTSEAYVLSQMVDGIIVVIMADKTKRDLVRRELKTISREKLLRVVLNCCEFETSEYYRRYHTYYGKEKD